MLRKTYRITGMHCTMCAMKLESLEDDLPGVKRVSASYRQQRAEIEFDETRVSEAQIVSAIQNLGYEVEA